MKPSRADKAYVVGLGNIVFKFFDWEKRVTMEVDWKPLRWELSDLQVMDKLCSEYPYKDVLTTIPHESRMCQSFLLQDKKGQQFSFRDVPCRSDDGLFFYITLNKAYWAKGRSVKVYSRREDFPTGDYMIYETVDHYYTEPWVSLIIKRITPELGTTRKIQNWLDKNQVMVDETEAVLHQFFSKEPYRLSAI